MTVSFNDFLTYGNTYVGVDPFVANQNGGQRPLPTNISVASLNLPPGFSSDSSKYLDDLAPKLANYLPGIPRADVKAALSAVADAQRAGTINSSTIIDGGTDGTNTSGLGSVAARTSHYLEDPNKSKFLNDTASLAAILRATALINGGAAAPGTATGTAAPISAAAPQAVLPQNGGVSTYNTTAGTAAPGTPNLTRADFHYPPGFEKNDSLIDDRVGVVMAALGPNTGLTQKQVRAIVVASSEAMAQGHGNAVNDGESMISDNNLVQIAKHTDQHLNDEPNPQMFMQNPQLMKAVVYASATGKALPSSMNSPYSFNPSATDPTTMAGDLAANLGLTLDSVPGLLNIYYAMMATAQSGATGDPVAQQNIDKIQAQLKAKGINMNDSTVKTVAMGFLNMVPASSLQPSLPV